MSIMDNKKNRFTDSGFLRINIFPIFLSSIFFSALYAVFLICFSYFIKKFYVGKISLIDSIDIVSNSFFINQFSIFGYCASVIFFLDRSIFNKFGDSIFDIFLNLRIIPTIISFLSGLLLSYFLIELFCILHIGRFEHDFSIIFVSTASTQLIVKEFSYALAIPFTEEIYFRGVLLRWLTSRRSATTSVILNTFLFSICHSYMLLNSSSGGYIFFGGVMAVGAGTALLYVHYRSLWPCIAFHCAYNFVLIAANL